MIDVVHLAFALVFWWFFLKATRRGDWPDIAFWAVALICFTLNGLVR